MKLIQLQRNVQRRLCPFPRAEKIVAVWGARPWQGGQRGSRCLPWVAEKLLLQEVPEIQCGQHISWLRAAPAQHTQALPSWLSQCSACPLTSDASPDLSPADMGIMDLSFLCEHCCYEVISPSILTFYSLFFFSCFFHHLFMQKNKYEIHRGVKKCSELASLC